MLYMRRKQSLLANSEGLTPNHQVIVSDQVVALPDLLSKHVSLFIKKACG